jgi:hypothetical protein
MSDLAKPAAVTAPAAEETLADAVSLSCAAEATAVTVGAAAAAAAATSLRSVKLEQLAVFDQGIALGQCQLGLLPVGASDPAGGAAAAAVVTPVDKAGVGWANLGAVLGQCKPGVLPVKACKLMLESLGGCLTETEQQQLLLNAQQQQQKPTCAAGQARGGAELGCGYRCAGGSNGGGGDSSRKRCREEVGQYDQPRICKARLCPAAAAASGKKVGGSCLTVSDESMPDGLDAMSFDGDDVTAVAKGDSSVAPDDVILIDVDKDEAAAAEAEAAAVAAAAGQVRRLVEGRCQLAPKRRRIEHAQRQKCVVEEGLARYPGVSPGYLCALACLGLDVKALLVQR